ncbi:MAG TPA: putative peptidoglycan-binding domain-containing protein [Solirubrobacteraceae bacterium]|nr:putative peptidoglycan-binding domain-containing protein [Solirubrobacteraceae bacterium]
MTRLSRLLPAPVLAAFLLAVPAFPAQANHRDDHHCTPDTRGALGERWPLSSGDKGQDIRVLQDFLNKLGDNLVVDGQFGPRTRRAVDGWKGAVGRKLDGRMTCGDIRVLREANTGVPKEGGRDKGPTPGAAPEGAQARITEDGFAVAPAHAPEAVKQIIAAGNEIAHKPYKYGGGHGRWEDDGYDCSGSVSYALYKAGIVKSSMPSGRYMNWEQAGEGDWVTVYAHEGHMYMVVAGLRFDTSGREGDSDSRWHEEMRDPKAYRVRHVEGL